MLNINPYLNFDGTTEEAFNFYKSVFGGEFALVMRWKDFPEPDKIPASQLDKIMHISLPIGKNAMLMATDACESMGPSLTAGNNFNILVSSESEEEADRLFNGLSAGGQQNMPMEKTFWGAYFGLLTDKFGIRWMVSYNYNQNN